MDSRERSFLDQMQTLHASGGDLNAHASVAGWGAPLFHAAYRGWCASIEFLCTHGADVNGKDSGWTPLHLAASSGHCDAAVLLLDAGARVDARNRYGWTALHRAANQGHTNMCQLLLSDDQDRGGSTALHLAAARQGYTNMCQLLLSRGASLDTRNQGGEDPEAFARRNNHPATADFLAAVRAAGGWWGYVDAQAAPHRHALLVLRRALPALRARRAATPWNAPHLYYVLFVDVPEDAFTAIFAYSSA